jgi:hypothetical protein
MILKKLSLFGLFAIIAAGTMLACQEDFTSEDFLKLRNNLVNEKEQRDSVYLAALTQGQAESLIAAQNEIGDLMSVMVLVREDNTPIAGVSVSLSAGAFLAEGGRISDAVTVVTDAAGRAVFERATIGENVISLSKANYVSASARVDFGAPAAPTPITTNVNGTSVIRYVAPPKRFENFSLPLYSTSATEGNTAIIQGTFRIQNDLTNDPNEMDPIPAGLVVAADLSTALTNEGDISSSCGCVLDYRFSSTAGSLGVAVINPTTGEFSMRVPATADGMNINMIYPIITGTQRIAVRRLNGVDITPEFRQVPVRWEPGVAASANIPVIPGARAVFTYNNPDDIYTPAPAGRGFTITNFTPVARPLELGTVSATGNTSLGATTYRINSRGSGYTTTPTVEITDGGGVNATAVATVRTSVSNFAITSSGVFTPSAFYDIEFYYFASPLDLNPTVYGEIEDIRASDQGALPLGSLTLPIADGFGNTPLNLPTSFSLLGIRIVNANTSVVAGGNAQTTFNTTQRTELASIQITNGGSGYTSAPTITLIGGGSLNQASVIVPAFRTQFDFSLPTDVATNPYRVLPSSIVFTYPTNAVDGQVIENIDLTPASSDNGGQVDMINPVGSVSVNSANLIDHLTTDGTNIIARNTAHTFRTDRAWTVPPVITVMDRTILPAAINLNIGVIGPGQVTIRNPTTDNLAINVNRLIPDPNNTITGQGYDAISVEIVPTISGASGSGAMFNLTTTQDVNTREVTWTGAFTTLSAGADYLTNLNRTANAQSYSTGILSVSAQTGKVYNININAGTGVRLENINN